MDTDITIQHVKEAGIQGDNQVEIYRNKCITIQHVKEACIQGDNQVEIYRNKC